MSDPDKRPRSNPFSLSAESGANDVVGERIGSQHPTNCWVPDYLDVIGDKAMRFLELVGFHLDPWQEFCLRVMLGMKPDDAQKFAAKEVCLLVPRQCGKTAVLEARALVGLFVLKERLIIHTAQLFPSCRESYVRLKGIIENCPDLADLVHFRSGNDNMGIEHEGRRILYLARGKNPIRGFSPDVVLLDESYALDEETMAAIQFALAARPNMQRIYASSTGLDDSDVLLRLRDRGLQEQGQHTLALLEWCAEGNDLDDLDQWYRAIPALGIRISLETVYEERRGQPDKQFGRERLGLWADNRFRAVVDLDLWGARKASDSEIVSKYVLALDATPSPPHDAAIAIAGFNAAGKKQVEVIRTDRTLSWCVEEIQGLYNAVRNPPPLAICVQAGAKAGSLIPELEKIRDRDGNPAEVIMFGARDVTGACDFFYDSIYDDSLVHLGDPTVLEALSGATKIHVGKLSGPKGEEEYRSWYWGRRDTIIDISPLCAITYALWGLNLKRTETDLNRSHYENKPRGGRLW